MAPSDDIDCLCGPLSPTADSKFSVARPQRGCCPCLLYLDIIHCQRPRVTAVWYFSGAGLRQATLVEIIHKKNHREEVNPIFHIMEGSPMFTHPTHPPTPLE
eukprot:TRINITY_DN423_c4_g1_i1.p1 TRINITY_DN423_c4_g1~~TRINITY_DN423_c4_g1_i1.p1  ORF type:complete len:102 (+),score=3.32 TRINITY_DN423_c4_g1_i1:459-764(+)